MYMCANLLEVNLPKELILIGEGAFAECPLLTNIDIPASVGTVGAGAFYDCASNITVTSNSSTTSFTLFTGDEATNWLLPGTGTIRGHIGSTAQTYATNFGINFESLDPIAPTLQSISITTPATKLNYTVGDTLDIAGLVVTGTYSDTSTTPETITIASITGFNSSSPATDQVLTITVGNKTTTYKIQVADQVAPSTYTVTFDSQGGSAVPSLPNVTTGSTISYQWFCQYNKTRWL